MPNPNDELEVLSAAFTATHPAAWIGTATVTPNATHDVDGTAVVLRPTTGHTSIADFDALRLVVSGAGEETLTLTLLATFDDATTATFVDTSGSSNIFEEANHGGGHELLDLAKSGHGVVSVTVTLKSSADASTASYVVTLYATEA